MEIYSDHYLSTHHSSILDCTFTSKTNTENLPAGYFLSVSLMECTFQYPGQYPAEKFYLLLRYHLHFSSATAMCQYSVPLSWLHLPLGKQSFPAESPSEEVTKLSCLGSGVSQPLYPIYQRRDCSQSLVKASQVIVASDEHGNCVHQKCKGRPHQLSENVRVRKALFQYVDTS